MIALPRMQASRRILNSLRLNSRAQSVAVDIRAGVGFFAQLNWCLYILAYCDRHSLTPCIRLIGSQYGPDAQHDWFHDFFVENRDALPASSRRPDRQQNATTSLSIHHINETRFAELYAPIMSLEWANRLFSTYYRVHPRVEAHVGQFIEEEFASGGVLGLHYRGTDKSTEATPVDWNHCLQSVKRYASHHPDISKVFVSSDDPAFIDWISAQLGESLPVISHPDQERSRDNLPVHLNAAGDGYRKGFEALVNCLLLSRCAALIRTASFLSGWSSVFRPALPVTLLNEPFEQTRWFPDREVLTRSDNRYR